MTRISREQVRAVFLTALMIGSVFGAGVAFTGSAAAGSLGVTLADNEVGETTTFTANYEVGSGNSGVPIRTVKFDLDGATTSEVTKENVTLTIRGNAVNVTDLQENSGLLNITFENTVSVSSGDAITVEVENVGVPTTTDSRTASLKLFNDDGSGNAQDSGSAGYTPVDTVPAISDFSAEFEGANDKVNVSFVANQSLKNGTDNAIAVSLSAESQETTTWLNSSSTDQTYTETQLANGDYLYYNTTSLSNDGVYTATLVNATDDDVNKQNAADGETATVTYDTESPVFDEVAPSDGANLTSVPETIRVQVNDSLSDIDRDSIDVTLTSHQADAGSYTFVDNVPVTKDNDGIAFTYAEGTQTTGNVTIDTDALPVKSFPDGNITVNVSASDALGNSNSTVGNFVTTGDNFDEYDFQLDTGANFQFELLTPDPENDESMSIGDKTILTNKTGEGIKVGVSGDTLEVANLTISNSTSTWGPFQSNSSDLDAGNGDVWNASTSTFNVTAGANDNLPTLTDGSYDITVNATDTFGNTEEDTTWTLEVDTTSPDVDDVSVNDTSIIEDEGLEVTVDFNESVDADTVQVNVSQDDDLSGSPAITDFDQGGDSDPSTVTATVNDVSNLAGFADLEDDEVFVNVTAGQDTIGNSIGERKETTISVDTKEPNHNNKIPSTLDAYVNLTQYVDNLPDDVASVTYHIKATDESSYTPIDDPESFDASQYDDDVYDVTVNVTDDAGNKVSKVTQSVVDLESPTVTTTFQEGEIVSGTISVNESFSVQNNDSAVSWTFEVDESSVGSSGEYDTTTNDDGHSLNVTAIATEDGEHSAGGGASTTVNLTVKHVEVDDSTTALTDTNAGLQVNVTTDEKVDTLEASVVSVDNFRNQVDEDLTLADFGEPTERADGNYTYTHTLSDLRDGQYDLNVTSAANNSRATITDLSTAEDTQTLDDSNATLVDAYITGYDTATQETNVELLFDEPVTGVDETELTFNGKATNQSTTPSVKGDASGTVTASFNGTIQTGDATHINASSIEEAHGGEKADSSTTLHTIELSLQSGTNFVSIPAEVGTLHVSELNLPEGSTVMAYDNGSWDTYVQDPDATDNDFTALEPGQGYVVNVDGQAYSVGVNVYNEPAQLDSTTELPSQDVEAGWNLLGHYQEGQQNAGNALSTVEDSTTNVETIYGLSGDGFTYNALDKSADSFVPGEAYWVFVDDPDDDDSYAPVTYAGA